MSVCAIIVTYHPQRIALENLLASLAAQVAEIVVVDNGSLPDEIIWLKSWNKVRVRLWQLGDNLGVATAHNRALYWAQKTNAFTHALLLDQDSLPAPDMVAMLLAGEVRAMDEHMAVAAVGPQHHDPRGYVQANHAHSNDSAQINSENPGGSKIGGWRMVNYLITSGTLLRLSTLKKIGMLEEGLFIDHVDLEWCFRARYKGYVCVCVSDAKMAHHIGDRVIRWHGWRLFSIRSSLRNYYLFRNAVLLYRRKYTPWAWIVHDAWRLVARYGIYTLVSSAPWQNLKMMTLGLWHGLRGVGGKYLERRADP